MQQTFRPWLQWIAALAFCTVWRLAPFRPPNVEPVLATMMPFGKRYGAVMSLLFCAANMVLFDAITGNLSQWTAVTAVTYAVIGAVAGLIFDQKSGIISYALFAVVATLFYDAITGVAAGAILFGMGWKEGFTGQIPFTINHLIGNVILAIVLSPVADWVLVQTSAELSGLRSKNHSTLPTDML